MITPETAKVWKTSHGRRYLTKRAAYLSEAIHRLKAKDRHEEAGIHDELRGGDHYQEVFYTADQHDLFSRIAWRYYRRFGRRAA